MRGADVMQESLFTYLTLSDFVPADHPLRPIREIVNTALAAMDASFGSESKNDIVPRVVPAMKRSVSASRLFGSIPLFPSIGRCPQP